MYIFLLIFNTTRQQGPLVTVSKFYYINSYLKFLLCYVFTFILHFDYIFSLKFNNFNSFIIFLFRSEFVPRSVSKVSVTLWLICSVPLTFC